MPDSISFNEYLAQAYRNALAGSPYFGQDFLKKQSYFTVDTDTNIFDATHGKRIWDALNNQVKFWNIVPKVVWGNRVGWRVRTDRGSDRSRPVTETGTLPTIDVSNIVEVNSLPRIVASSFGISLKAMIVAQLEGGAGDMLAAEHEFVTKDHIKDINQQLLAGSAYLVSAGAQTTFTVPASIAHHFKIGDAVSMHDENAGAYDRTTGSVVSGVNTTTGVVTIATDTAFADGDIAFIYSRNGFTSIDDIVAQDVTANTNTGVGGSASEVRAYNFTLGGRTAGTWNAGALVSYNAGVGRDLSLNLLDNAIRNVRINGGEPKVIVMGHDQYFRLERLLNTNQRYLGTGDYQVGVGGEKTYPGTETGMVVSTYQKIPIITDPDCPHSVATDDSVLGSNIYVLDTDSLEIAVAQETQYTENRDYFAINGFIVRGLVHTLGELRCRLPWHQAKIADLNE